MKQLTIAEEFQHVKNLAEETGDERVKKFVSFVEKIVISADAKQTPLMVTSAIVATEALFNEIEMEDHRYRYFARFGNDVRRVLKDLKDAIILENICEIHHRRMAVMGTVHERILHYR